MTAGFPLDYNSNDLILGLLSIICSILLSQHMHHYYIVMVFVLAIVCYSITKNVMLSVSSSLILTYLVACHASVEKKQKMV